MIHEEISLLSFYSFQQASLFEHLKSTCIIEHHRRKLFKNFENPISSHEKVLILGRLQNICPSHATGPFTHNFTIFAYNITVPLDIYT